MPRSPLEPYEIAVTYRIEAKSFEAAERCAENITKYNSAMVNGGDYIWQAVKGKVHSVKAVRVA